MFFYGDLCPWEAGTAFQSRLQSPVSPQPECENQNLVVRKRNQLMTPGASIQEMVFWPSLFGWKVNCIMVQIGLCNDVPKSPTHSLIHPGVIECLLCARKCPSEESYTCSLHSHLKSQKTLGEVFSHTGLDYCNDSTHPRNVKSYL